MSAAGFFSDRAMRNLHAKQMFCAANLSRDGKLNRREFFKYLDLVFKDDQRESKDLYEQVFAHFGWNPRGVGYNRAKLVFDEPSTSNKSAARSHASDMLILKLLSQNEKYFRKQQRMETRLHRKDISLSQALKFVEAVTEDTAFQDIPKAHKNDRKTKTKKGTMRLFRMFSRSSKSKKQKQKQKQKQTTTSREKPKTRKKLPDSGRKMAYYSSKDLHAMQKILDDGLKEWMCAYEHIRKLKEHNKFNENEHSSDHFLDIDTCGDGSIILKKLQKQKNGVVEVERILNNNAIELEECVTITPIEEVPEMFPEVTSP